MYQPGRECQYVYGGIDGGEDDAIGLKKLPRHYSTFNQFESLFSIKRKFCFHFFALHILIVFLLQ
jgi:hypothetical protein